MISESPKVEPGTLKSFRELRFPPANLLDFTNTVPSSEGRSCHTTVASRGVYVQVNEVVETHCNALRTVSLLLQLIEEPVLQDSKPLTPLSDGPSLDDFEPKSMPPKNSYSILATHRVSGNKTTHERNALACHPRTR